MMHLVMFGDSLNGTQNIEFPARHSMDALPRVFRKPSKIPGAGDGAFAGEDISQGTVVTMMEKPRYINREDAEEREDTDIYSTIMLSRDFSILDDNLTFEYAPTWYWFNHKSSKFNLKASAENGNVIWKAIRDIKEGDELTWQYDIQRNMHGAFVFVTLTDEEPPLTLN